MLRAQARQAVIDSIECSYFGAANFIVQFGDGNPILLDISFIPDRNFKFTMSFDSNEPYFTPRHLGNKYKSTEAPGEKFLAAQSFHYTGIETGFSRLDRWLERVREELISSNPFARELAELRSQVEERITQLGQDLEDFFSTSEAAALTARLDELSEKLSELEAKNEQLELDVTQLAKVVDDLKSATSLVNKGTWYRMANGRLLSGLKALATSKEAREFALEAAKRFLLEGPK